MNKNRPTDAGKQLAGRSRLRGTAAMLVVTGLGLALAGCGYSTGDRAVSGGMLGAGAGAVVGAVTGGAVTSHHDVNLGRPIWRD